MEKLRNQQEDEASLQRRNKKKHLLDSIVVNNAVEIEELSKRAEKVEKPENATDIIREYEEILRAKKRTSSWLHFTKEKFLNA